MPYEAVAHREIRGAQDFSELSHSPLESKPKVGVVGFPDIPSVHARSSWDIHGALRFG